MFVYYSKSNNRLRFSIFLVLKFIIFLDVSPIVQYEKIFENIQKKIFKKKF